MLKRGTGTAFEMMAVSNGQMNANQYMSISPNALAGHVSVHNFSQAFVNTINDHSRYNGVPIQTLKRECHQKTFGDISASVQIGAATGTYRPGLHTIYNLWDALVTWLKFCTRADDGPPMQDPTLRSSINLGSDAPLKRKFRLPVDNPRSLHSDYQNESRDIQ